MASFIINFFILTLT